MKNKFLIITGGTGGHVIPANNFANYLISKNINCRLILDKRGYSYIDKSNCIINIVNSSNLNGGIFSKVIGLLNLFIGFLKSFLIILIFKPKFVLSFGSYASFFPMMSCILLKPFYNIEIYIHEQNSIIGRSNNFYLKYANKLFLNFDLGTNNKKKIYLSNSYIVGSPEKNNVSKYKKKYNFDKSFTIFIFGGSQGSVYISSFALNLIKLLDDKKLNIKFIIQCPKKNISKISMDLKHLKKKIIIKEYFHNIDEILQNTTIAISRAGAGSINDLIRYKIPSILIPLPSAKDNHQFYNASVMTNHEVAIILDQRKDEYNKAKNFIHEMYRNVNKLKIIRERFEKIKVTNSNSLIYKLITNEK